MPTIEHQTTQQELPRSWAALAESLGVSRHTLIQHRKALDLMEAEINPLVVEELRRSTRFTSRRNTGGGGHCTLHTYVLLQTQNKLEDRLKALRII